MLNVVKSYTCYILFAEIHCGILEAPTNGSKVGSDDLMGSDMTFSCDSGFRLEGSVQRNCTEEGAWDGVETKCIG